MNRLFMLIGGLLGGLGLSLLWGCKTMTVAEPQAAILIESDQNTLLEITKVVSQAFDGKSVSLAESILQTSNELVVVPNDPETLDGKLSGRLMTRPQTFHLMLRGAECYLLHVDQQTEYVLSTVKCTPLS